MMLQQALTVGEIVEELSHPDRQEMISQRLELIIAKIIRL
jgi:hypothetical protein